MRLLGPQWLHDQMEFPITIPDTVPGVKEFRKTYFTRSPEELSHDTLLLVRLIHTVYVCMCVWLIAIRY